jgi:hypothetical protein
VRGEATHAPGIIGWSDNGAGIHAGSGTSFAIFAENDNLGVPCIRGDGRGGGVFGVGHEFGVSGSSDQGPGVSGSSTKGPGVSGDSIDRPGVFGSSQTNEGVHGETKSATFAAVAGIMLNPDGTGAGVYGESRGKGPAGFFKGDVEITGDLILAPAPAGLFGGVTHAGDVAEDFTLSAEADVEPGTVVVLEEGGEIVASQHPYDRRVAGVVSGAGYYRPGLVLDRRPSEAARRPVALVGKVFCKADASYARIEVGDLMTTSPTAGHAMKASDPTRAFGAVIGKALGRLGDGRGLIPILVALQ